VTKKAEKSWKVIAIILGLLLGAVLIYTAVVATGLMKLGLSLL
jgi:hypothetical protein